MAKQLDTYAIRLIHHHGQLSRDYELPSTSTEYRKTLALALESVERELKLDYQLTLPDGIATTN